MRRDELTKLEHLRTIPNEKLTEFEKIDKNRLMDKFYDLLR